MDRNSIEPANLTVSTVALRKESVDRNLYYGDDLTFSDVALRKESVDRNAGVPAHRKAVPGRSPQGERG